MPTAPSKRKHGKDYLDEAVAKSTYRKKPITRHRAFIAGILAIPLGCIGFHDLLLRNKKRGFIHCLISSIAFAMVIFPLAHGFAIVYQCQNGGECLSMAGYDDTLNAIVIAGLVIFAASVIWGIVEGIIILTHLNRFTSSED